MTASAPEPRWGGWLGAAIVAALAVAALVRAPQPGVAPLSARVSAAGPQASGPGSHGSAPAPSAPLPAAPIGYVDSPTDEVVVGPAFRATGWALDAKGMRGVEIRLRGERFPAVYGFPRPDVAKAQPGFPANDRSGFLFEGEWPDAGGTRQPVEIVAIGESGETVLARKVLDIPPMPRDWGRMLDQHPDLAAQRLYLLMMASAVNDDMARAIAARYRPYVSRTMRVGLSVPILYLRSTQGAANDWKFDPAFDLARKCGQRAVVEDNLDKVIGLAIAHRLPVQFILNGGIWSDASCETPEWDLTDHLEQDDANVQWTQDDRTFPDDLLKGQAGSTESPELARSLTYHVYAKDVRSYKRRNLQAAASRIAKFAREHPDLFVGIALDADTYMNPFLRQGGHKEVFDYNPGMLRQFREWLRGSGPYAGQGGPGVPDLRAYRRSKPLTLEQVNRIARRQWNSWEKVEPPRRFPGMNAPPAPGEIAIWDDPWWHEWDVFRKHVIDLHYDELSSWVREAGIPRDRIFSAQGGFLEPDPGLKPFAIRVTDHGENYDSAGVSVEGSLPRDGHLGTILYGPQARNRITMRGPHSLFATFARMDEGWGVVEFNPTDLRKPGEQTGYAVAYEALREMFNYGAREISTMAWNGSNGLASFAPGYVPYTAWQNTPGEDALRDFLVARADLPLGSQIWTFGSPHHASDDGWTSERGTIAAGKGYVDVRPEPAVRAASGAGSADSESVEGIAVVASPRDLVIRPSRIGTLFLKLADPHPVRQIEVSARTGPADPWIRVAASEGSRRNAGADGILTLPLEWPSVLGRPGTIVTQLQVTLHVASATAPVRVERVVLYPRSRTLADGVAGR